MKRFEKFLNHFTYPLLIAVFAAIAWYFDGDLIWINYAFITVYMLLMIVILSLFEDTKYIIPIILSLFFMINIRRIGMDALETFSIAYVIAGLGVIGMIVHFIRFRHHFKMSWLAFSFLLTAISYVIPLLYTEVTYISVVLSLTGFLYLALYFFFKDTSEAKLETILRYFFYASVTLMLQIGFVIITGYIRLSQIYNAADTLRIGLKTGWGRTDYGFGNINSLLIHLTILSGGVMYKIIKQPKIIIYWFVAIIQMIIVVLSGSRGGYLAWTILIFLYFIILGVYGKKWQVGVAAIIGFAFVSLAFHQIEGIKIIFEVLKQGGLNDLNNFSTGRIELFRKGLAVFKQNPLFGAGWTHAYEPETHNPTRVMIYHSTVIQTLAISGLFGMAVLVFYSIIVPVVSLKRFNLQVFIALTVWIVTMIHGLIDNTIHLIIYTLLTMILFAAVEKEPLLVESESIFEFMPLSKLHN